jgi:hypothetical protein
VCGEGSEGLRCSTLRALCDIRAAKSTTHIHSAAPPGAVLARLSAGESMGDPGPSSAAPPGLDDEDDDQEIDETAALQIETVRPQHKPRGLHRLVDMVLPRRGRARVGASGSREGVGGGVGALISKCTACFPQVAGLGGGEAEEEPLLFALTWAQPQRYGIAPSPRNGHTMVLIGMHLYIFGGGDETISYNDVHTLHVGTMSWDKPVVHGTMPSPRSRHSATAVGNNMVIFGGVGGGNDLHILETDTLTWYVPKVGGEPPLPRFGHSSTLVESQRDQSRKLYIFGGHDGRRSLSDLHLFDTESMSWSKVPRARHRVLSAHTHSRAHMVSCVCTACLLKAARAPSPPTPRVPPVRAGGGERPLATRRFTAHRDPCR